MDGDVAAAVAGGNGPLKWEWKRHAAAEDRRGA